MIRKIENRMFKVNTYASNIIFEVDDCNEEDILKLKEKLGLSCYGYKLNLLVKIAEMSVVGYAIASVTEFNPDGTKPKFSYASDKDYKKIIKHYLEGIQKK